MESYNSFKVARQQVLEAAKILNLDEATTEFLSTLHQEVNVTLPVKMDSGETKIFQAFRIQYNHARGPAKGGIRFHPDETVSTIRAVACWMTWKSAVVDLPLGGSKGSVRYNHKNCLRWNLKDYRENIFVQFPLCSVLILIFLQQLSIQTLKLWLG